MIWQLPEPLSNIITDSCADSSAIRLCYTPYKNANRHVMRLVLKFDIEIDHCAYTACVMTVPFPIHDRTVLILMMKEDFCENQHRK